MYDHIKGLKRMGAADVPVGDSIESDDARKARTAAVGADKPKASVDITNTEAVKEAIKTHVTTVGKAKIAGFGPTSAGSGSGIHSHPDAFHKRKGVVNTMGGAKDVSREAKTELAHLPPRGPGGAPPGARMHGLSSLDPHAEEGKAKRAAAEAKMRSASTGPSGLGGPGSTATGARAHIAGFNKNMGVATVAGGPAKRTGGGGGASVADALTAAGKPPSHAAAGAGAASAAPRGFVGGHGRVGGAAATGEARTGSSSSSRSDPGHGPTAPAAAASAAPRAGAGGASGAGAGSAAAAPDAARRAAFFKQQMAEKAAKTAAAVELLKGKDA